MRCCALKDGGVSVSEKEEHCESTAVIVGTHQRDLFVTECGPVIHLEGTYRGSPGISHPIT